MSGYRALSLDSAAGKKTGRSPDLELGIRGSNPNIRANYLSGLGYSNSRTSPGLYQRRMINQPSSSSSPPFEGLTFSYLQEARRKQEEERKLKEEQDMIKKEEDERIKKEKEERETYLKKKKAGMTKAVTHLSTKLWIPQNPDFERKVRDNDLNILENIKSKRIDLQVKLKKISLQVVKIFFTFAGQLTITGVAISATFKLAKDIYASLMVRICCMMMYLGLLYFFNYVASVAIEIAKEEIVDSHLEKEKLIRTMNNLRCTIDYSEANPIPTNLLLIDAKTVDEKSDQDWYALEGTAASFELMSEEIIKPIDNFSDHIIKVTTKMLKYLYVFGMAVGILHGVWYPISHYFAPAAPVK